MAEQKPKTCHCWRVLGWWLDPTTFEIRHKGRLVKILQFSATLLSSLPCGDNLDVNMDGLVDVIDATLILQLGAGLIATLPV